MKTTVPILSPGNIHKALRLPGTYRISVSLSGHDTSKGFEGASWLELRRLSSPTLGTVTVYAVSESRMP